jgi:G3E family GTPase
MKHYPGTPPRSIRTIVAVDAVRFHAIMKALNRPLTAQLKAADVILINKADAVSADALKGMEAELREINADRPIIPTSATGGTNIDKVVEAMVGA